jgi:hypothetical protein
MAIPMSTRPVKKAYNLSNGASKNPFFNCIPTRGSIKLKTVRKIAAIPSLKNNWIKNFIINRLNYETHKVTFCNTSFIFSYQVKIYLFDISTKSLGVAPV